MSYCNLSEKSDFYIWCDGIVYTVALKIGKDIGGSRYFYFYKPDEVIEFIITLRDKYGYLLPERAIDKLNKDMLDKNKK